jgi:uncharacterized protein (TIRG00374 family)
MTRQRLERSVVIRMLSVVFSATLLFLLYQSIDFRAVARVLRDAHPLWLAISVSMLLPITVMRAARFKWLVPAHPAFGLAEALRMTLVASAVNLFLPAKTGDFSKSIVLAQRGEAAVGTAAAIVVFERLADLLGLIAWCLVGAIAVKPVVPVLPSKTWGVVAGGGIAIATLLVHPRFGAAASGLASQLRLTGRLAKVAHGFGGGWHELLTMLGSSRIWLIAFSVGLWFVQLLQVWLFTVAVGASVPAPVSASLSAIALVLGQLPLTFAGIGVRDVALVVLFAQYMSPEQAAAVGILSASRNLLPPLAALPFLRRYIALIVTSRGVSGAARVA